MTDLVRTALIKSLTESGNNEGLIKLLNITDASEIEGAISALETNSNELDLDQVFGNPDVKSRVDSLVLKAIKKREENLKTKYNFVKKEAGQETTEDDLTGDVDSTLGKKLSKLEQMVENQRLATILEKKTAEALGKLKAKKIPEKYIKFIDFDSEDLDLDTQITNVENDLSEFKKEVISEAVPSGGMPFPQDLGSKVTEDEVNSIVDDL